MSGDAPVEEIVARLRPHGRALVWPSIALIAVAGAVGYFIGRFTETWQQLALVVIAALVILVLWIVPVVAWLGRNYTITTRRVILRSGFFVRVRQELLHSRGYDVTVRRSALQTVFRSANVELTAGSDRSMVLRDVPRADLVQAALHDLIEASQYGAESRRTAGRDSDETTFWGTR